MLPRNSPTSTAGARMVEQRRRSVLIGGPIQHGLLDGVFERNLRTALENLIQRAGDTGYQVLSAHVAESFGDAEGPFTPEIVTRRDYDWVLASDVYVAVLPSKVFSGGTCIELGWASAHHVPILVLWN